MNNIKKLGEYLARVLDEDQWKTAEDLLNKIDNKLTQQDKEEVYNKYMEFVDKISDDLDTFSEVSPKELVYAVLGLVDELFSGNCKTCHKGTMKEMSIYDDMDGMLTYDKCGVRAEN